MNDRLKKEKSWAQKGFTLIEILIVVIVLGILAMIIIPQITVSTEDAKLSTLSTNLNAMRNAIELYYHQHNNTYPGAVLTDAHSAGDQADATNAEMAFLSQLTMYTTAAGAVDDEKAGDYKFGPYLKSKDLPTNPFNDLNDVTCDTTETSISVRASDSSTAWKFYTLTGNLIANDGAHDDL